MKLVKVTDEAALVRCASGDGLIREEVWKDAEGKVIRFNLAFINFHLFAGDNGRVLGYDSAHGQPHRHFAGVPSRRSSRILYDVIFDRFLAGSWVIEDTESIMKTKIYTDGFEGWAKRARERARAITEGRAFPPSRGITFESPAEMVRLLTPARLDLFEKVKKQTVSITELARSLGRDVSAVRRDVSALEKFGIVSSRQVVNPGHGRARMVSAPASISISAEL
jgi:predicted transcriptional regulator